MVTRLPERHPADALRTSPRAVEKHDPAAAHKQDKKGAGEQSAKMRPPRNGFFTWEEEIDELRQDPNA
jgi:hypothetical protein